MGRIGLHYDRRMTATNPCLWFDGRAEEAARFYVSLFPNSAIDEVVRAPGSYHAGEAGSVLAVRFNLSGVPYLALNAGPDFKFSEAISFQINCADQAEVDHYWEGLVAGGGEHGRCGWLKDRFGLSWQVNPREMNRYIGGQDPDGAARAMAAMMKMGKLVVAELRAAYEGS
jgi:predicted 3-demethylubiquinone-9 3-methyltransferase (glyoxalase superfamily)